MALLWVIISALVKWAHDVFNSVCIWPQWQTPHLTSNNALWFFLKPCNAWHIKLYIYFFGNIRIYLIFTFTFTFTFMHLADAFIQSDLQLHSGYTFSSVRVFPGNRTHNLLRCWRNALTTEPQEHKNFYKKTNKQHDSLT